MCFMCGGGIVCSMCVCVCHGIMSPVFLRQLERTNYQLQVFVETARNKEPADGRLLQHLLKTPASEDGGQWDMLVGLVEKHGVMPQDCFPDTWSAQTSRKLGVLLDTKVWHHSR